MTLNRTVKHRVTGEEITFVETAAETGGKYLLIEVALPPQGDGPPLHVHDQFEEEFEVLEGVLTVTAGKDKHELAAGDTIKATRGTAHTFTNNADAPVRFRVRLTPPSGFEESVRIHYGLMDDGLTDAKGNPKRLAHTALVLGLQNTWIAGVPLWLQKRIFKLVIKRGVKSGAYDGFEKYTGRKLEL